MTTTTLSSNKSSEKLFDRKLFSMMAGCLRQNGILMAMYTVGLLLVTVLPTFYDLRQYTPVNPSESQLFTDSFFYAVTGIIVPVLLAAILFHYLHNRLSVDFYHSMPVSRNKLFLSRYFAGIVFLVVPITICRLICIVMHCFAFRGFFSVGWIISHLLMDLLSWIILHLTVFTFSCMIAVTSSNAAESIIYSIAINGCLTGIVYIFFSLANMLYGVELNLNFSFLSPYGMIALYQSMSYADDIPGFLLYHISIWALLSVAALFLTLRLYHHFHSEWAQQWGRQSAFSQLMKLLAGFLTSFILFVSLFNPIFEDQVQSCLIGALVGGPLGFLLVEGITGKGFGNLGKNLKYIALTVLVCLTCPVFLFFDGFGIVSRVPDLQDIEKIELTIRSQDATYEILDWNNPGTSSTRNYLYITLSSERSKEIVRELHQRAIEEGKDYSGLRGNSLSISYTLPHSEMNRGYSFALSDLPLIQELFCQPEFVEQSQAVFSYTPQILQSVSCYDKLGTYCDEIDAEKYQQLLTAVQTDLLNLTPELLNDYEKDPVVGYLEWVLKPTVITPGEGSFIIENGDQVTFGNSALVIRSSYQNTLSLLKSWGMQPQNTYLDGIHTVSVFMPDSYDMNINLRSTIDYRSFGLGEKNYRDIMPSEHGDTVFWDITDPQQMEALVTACTPFPTSSSCNPIYFQSDSEKNGNSCRKMYIENSVLLSIVNDSQEISYLLNAEELDQFFKIHKKSDSEYSTGTISPGDFVDTSTYLSVAEFAHQNNLDWFTDKTSEQLDAMERTGFISPDGQYSTYDGVESYHW